MKMLRVVTNDKVFDVDKAQCSETTYGLQIIVTTTGDDEVEHVMKYLIPWQKVSWVEEQIS